MIFHGIIFSIKISYLSQLFAIIVFSAYILVWCQQNKSLFSFIWPSNSVKHNCFSEIAICNCMMTWLWSLELLSLKRYESRKCQNRWCFRFNITYVAPVRIDQPISSGCSVCALLILLHKYIQKYSRLRCLLHVKGLVICFYLGWSGSILQFRRNR